VDAGDLGGACEVTNRNGAVTVSSVAGNLKIVNERDSVTVSGAGAEWRSRRPTERLSGRRPRDVRIRDDHGEVEVEGAGGAVEWRVASARSPWRRWPAP